MHIELKGSELVGSTRRAHLQPFAADLVRFVETNGSEITSATASKHLRQNPAFRVAM